MDVDTLLNAILGGGAPAAAGITPKLTKRSKDLPGSQQDRVKKDLKANPQMGGPGMTGTPVEQDPTELLMEMILSANPNEMTPKVKMTQKGEPAKNQNMMSEAVKKLKTLSDEQLAEFLEMNGEPDDDDYYGDGED